MSADKYLSIFSRQMEAIVYLLLLLSFFSFFFLLQYYYFFIIFFYQKLATCTVTRSNIILLYNLQQICKLQITYSVGLMRGTKLYNIIELKMVAQHTTSENNLAGMCM